MNSASKALPQIDMSIHIRGFLSDHIMYSVLLHVYTTDICGSMYHRTQ